MIDSSLWIPAYRDRTGALAARIAAARGTMDEVFSRFVAMEILRGSNDEADWRRFERDLETQIYVEFEEEDWKEAARLSFVARKAGCTIRGLIDCCIAQTAIRHQLLLLHNDNDFEHLAKVSRLQQSRVRLQ